MAIVQRILREHPWIFVHEKVVVCELMSQREPLRQCKVKALLKWPRLVKVWDYYPHWCTWRVKLRTYGKILQHFFGILERRITINDNSRPKDNQRDKLQHSYEYCPGFACAVYTQNLRYVYHLNQLGFQRRFLVSTYADSVSPMSKCLLIDLCNPEGGVSG